jgi:hypothetical protein
MTDLAEYVAAIGDKHPLSEVGSRLYPQRGRIALALELLAVCENPDAFSVGHDPRDPALSQLRRACTALLALAKERSAK